MPDSADMATVAESVEDEPTFTCGFTSPVSDVLFQVVWKIGGVDYGVPLILADDQVETQLIGAAITVDYRDTTVSCKNSSLSFDNFILL